MNLTAAKELLLRKRNAFHNRYGKAYGQIMLRADNMYLMSTENLPLSDISDGDIAAYDINTGDIGLLFRTFPNINAMVFICTKASVRFSDNNTVMLPALDDLAQIVGPDVPVCESRSASLLVKALKHRNGCFIKGSGILAVGSDIEEAIAVSRIIEKSAQVEIYGAKIGGVKHLSKDAAKYLNETYNKSYSTVNSKTSVPFINFNESEFKLRNDLIECGKRMCWDDLVQGSWGNISVRLSDNEMLTTPSAMDYFTIKPEDIVKLDLETLDYDNQRVPTSESKLHAEIYKTKKDCNAIIHTHSNGCSVFAAAQKGFKLEDPILREVVGDLNVSSYAPPRTEVMAAEVLKVLETSNACIMANHGALFCGNSLELAIGIANAIESKACNLLGFGDDEPISAELQQKTE